jgi:3-hydroxybutyrate dehydrogenase
VITGGGSGIGADFCRGFARRAPRSWIAGRRREPLRKVAGGNDAVSCGRGDVTDEASVAAMFEPAGPVDIVIANAGAAESSPLRSRPSSILECMLAVNLTGTFLTFRAGLRRHEGRAGAG